MNQAKRVELYKVVNHCFDNGPNKVNIMYNLEKFINKFYESKYISIAQEKNKYLNELAKDILKAGGLSAWKKDLKKKGRYI